MLRNQVLRLADRQGELEIQLRQERRESDKLSKRLRKELRLVCAMVEQHREERDSALEQVRSLEQCEEAQNRSWRNYGVAYRPCVPSLSRQTKVRAKYSAAEEGVLFSAPRKECAAEDMPWSSRIRKRTSESETG